jgi:hypothetical protein
MEEIGDKERALMQEDVPTSSIINGGKSSSYANFKEYNKMVNIPTA